MEIVRYIGDIRRALRASVVSGYPRGHERDRDLAVFERLLGADVLAGLDEIDWLGSTLETTCDDTDADSEKFRAVFASRRRELLSDITTAVRAMRRRVDSGR